MRLRQPLDFRLLGGGPHEAGRLEGQRQTLVSDDRLTVLPRPAPLGQRVAVAVPVWPLAGRVADPASIGRTGIIADQLGHEGAMRPALCPPVPTEVALCEVPLRVDFPLQRTGVPAIGERGQHALAQTFAVQGGVAGPGTVALHDRHRRHAIARQPGSDDLKVGDGLRLLRSGVSKQDERDRDEAVAKPDQQV